jgi:hypothetical protein
MYSDRPQPAYSWYIVPMCFLVSLYFLWARWDWVRLVRRTLIGLLYQPKMIDDDECGAIGRIIIDRGNRSTRRKPAPESLCPARIPHDLTWAWTLAAAVGSRQLTAWVMPRPYPIVFLEYNHHVPFCTSMICNSCTEYQNSHFSMSLPLHSRRLWYYRGNICS